MLFFFVAILTALNDMAVSKSSTAETFTTAQNLSSNTSASGNSSITSVGASTTSISTSTSTSSSTTTSVTTTRAPCPTNMCINDYVQFVNVTLNDFRTTIVQNKRLFLRWTVTNYPKLKPDKFYIQRSQPYRPDLTEIKFRNTGKSYNGTVDIETDTNLKNITFFMWATKGYLRTFRSFRVHVLLTKPKAATNGDHAMLIVFCGVLLAIMLSAIIFFTCIKKHRPESFSKLSNLFSKLVLNKTVSFTMSNSKKEKGKEYGLISSTVPTTGSIEKTKSEPALMKEKAETPKSKKQDLSAPNFPNERQDNKYYVGRRKVANEVDPTEADKKFDFNYRKTVCETLPHLKPVIPQLKQF